MTRPGDKDWLPYDEYLRRAARKRCSAGAIFLNEAGEMLLVKPGYKEGWTIPGGAVDTQESPRNACVREVAEELGLNIPLPEFIAVIHVPRPEKNDEVLHFMFFGGTLSSQQIHEIKIQPSELDEYRFVPIDEVGQYANKNFTQVVPQLMQAIEGHRPVFIDEPGRTQAS